MVAKKEYYKKRMQEKKIQIIESLIEEELDLYLSEQEEYGDGKYHGISRLYKDRGTFTGMLLSPVVDIANALKIGAAKAGTQLLAMGATAIAGTILGILPFSNPNTVKYISQKMRYWEQENLKNIDKQFEKELGQMRQGWETFKTDFWGIGFVVSPINAIAAIATAEKGLDMGLSVLNVVSGGQVTKIIDAMNKDVEDPGDLKTFLQKGKEDEEKKREQRVNKAIESERCFQHLDVIGHLDPSCIGADLRDNFPAGASGTADFIKFVEKKLRDYNDTREERFEIQFPDKEYKGAFSDQWGRVNRKDLINFLRSNGYVNENIRYDGDKIIIEQVVQKAIQAITGQRPQTGNKSLNALHAKVDGWVKSKQITKQEANEFFKKLKDSTIQNPAVVQAANRWSAANTSKMMTNIFTNINNDIATGKAGSISPQEIAAYKAKGPQMVQAIFKNLSKSKKFKPVPNPAALKAAQQAVTTAMAKMPKVTTPGQQPQQQTQVAVQPQAAPPPPAQPATPPAAAAVPQRR